MSTMQTKPIHGDAKSYIVKQLQSAVYTSFPNIVESLPSQQIDPLVTVSSQKQQDLCDYQCNIALVLSKNLKMNPLDVAKSLRTAFSQASTHSIVDNIIISGPGFLNFALTEDYVKKRILTMLGQFMNLKVYYQYRKSGT